MTWSYYWGGGGGHVKFLGDKKRLVDGEYLNNIIALAVSKALKMNKNYISNTKVTPTWIMS